MQFAEWSQQPAYKQVLVFDIEARPLSWIGADYCSKEITAIGASFVGEKKTHCWLLGVHEPEDMLQGFVDLYNRSDMVVGHYVRRYDLPVINSALLDYQIHPLSAKLVQDTKEDLKKLSGISKSQESLAATLSIKAPKVGMNQVAWREANRLTPEGIQATKQRVLGDVKQSTELLAKLQKLHWLNQPKTWRP